MVLANSIMLKRPKYLGLMVLAGLFAGCVSAEQVRRADALRDLGTSYLNEGSTEDALRELENAKKLNPRDAGIRHALGMAFFAKGLPEKAQKELLMAIRLDPTLTEAKLNLSSLYIAQERYEEAIEQIELVVSDYLYRSPARAYNNMGWAYFKLERFEEAEKAYLRALQIAPRFCQVHHNVGLLYLDRDDIESAVGHLEQAVEQCPELLRFRLDLGIVQANLDRRGEALENLQQVARSDPHGALGATARERLRDLR